VSILETKDVSKAFGELQALTGCSIEVDEGEIMGVIGPNGSGKTTLFNVITGYVPLDQGQVRFDGRVITNVRPDTVFGLGIGRTFQLTRIFPRLTVLENMHVAVQRKGARALLLRWSSSQEQQRSLALLDFVGLAHLKDALAGSLSYGQKKLLEFAFILIADPRVILLDEPAGGINPALLVLLTERIRDLNRQGVTFVVVEHNMEFVMRLCDRITVLHRGGTIAQGKPQQVRENPLVLEAYLGA
jgi:neutral amino acid transport system ATP-binding protein